MKFEEVYHGNKWTKVYKLKKIHVIKGSRNYFTFVVNNSFELQARDHISFLCSKCGSKSSVVFRFKDKFFRQTIKCKRCEVNEKRKITWKNRYGVDHPCKTKEMKEKFSKYFSENPTKGFLGHNHTEEVKNKLSIVNAGNKKALGHRMTEEQRLKISEGLKRAHLLDPKIRKNMSKYFSENPTKGFLGHNHTEEAKKIIAKKVRLKRIEKIKENKELGFQIVPFWNSKACDYFEKFDKDNNTQGQHARNGGEFHIKELGYWIDYINHDMKLIMEYDEKHHYDIYGNLRKKDATRQEEIQNLYSDYEFIRIKENEV